MSFGQSLDSIADSGAYGPGAVTVRWGQLMREHAELSTSIATSVDAGRLSSLGALGSLHSGVVTRANGFFIVRELPFDEIPGRMRITRADMRRIAVIVDSMGVPHKVERQHLKPVIKGPEQLESAFAIKPSAMRLLDVSMDKAALSAASHTGALAYLQRGETIPYSTSEDSLKGGIPAQRSQVRNRKPHWYSLQGLRPARLRIVIPEHIDRRYVFTLVPDADDSVVIDTLYVYEPTEGEDAGLIHMGMNSLLTWYQVELRGRSQHGEGVLKVKLPDYRGVLVCNPSVLDADDRQVLLSAFAALNGVAAGPSLEELGSPSRTAFEVAYLSACGFEDPEGTMLLLQQELRALSGERLERRLSVVDAKVSRRRATNAGASVNAHAARVASKLPALPDPRAYVDPSPGLVVVTIAGNVGGELTVGTELFDEGTVKEGGEVVATAGNVLGAEMVRAVLLIDGDVREVSIPTGTSLARAHAEWSAAAARWHAQFESELARVSSGLTDQRLVEAIRTSALRTLRAIQ